jgi:hypothetical protein
MFLSLLFFQNDTVAPMDIDPGNKMLGCDYSDMLLLRRLTNLTPGGDTTNNCTIPDIRSASSFDHILTPVSILTDGQLFFTYFTPIVFFIGLFGNSVSLRIFLSKNMRHLSASVYLAALSSSDLMALIFYVLPEWIKRGLPTIPGHVNAPWLEKAGVCEILLYFQYIFRFMSAWLVVGFTVERYIGVCHPLRRKDLGDAKSSRRIVLGLVVLAAGFCVFKPVLSGVYPLPVNDETLICTSDPRHKFTSFVLDSIFGISITFVPFIVITVLNMMIIRKLFIRNRRMRECRVITEESIIRLEFTFILLAVSFCFIAFNLPYFIVWCRYFLTSHRMPLVSALATDATSLGVIQNVLLITRTIFYMNYCINFFLYSVTGAYFRKELKMLFSYKQQSYGNQLGSPNNTNTNTTTPQSWV